MPSWTAPPVPPACTSLGLQAAPPAVRAAPTPCTRPPAEAAQLLALKVQLSDGLVPAEAKTEFEALRLASAGLAAALAKCSGSTWSASATMVSGCTARRAGGWHVGSLGR